MTMSAKRPSLVKAAPTLSSLVEDQGPGDTIRLSVILDREMHTQLKVLAAKDHTTVSKIVKKLLSDLLKDSDGAQKD